MVMSLQTRFEYRWDSSLCEENTFYLDSNKVNYVKLNIRYEEFPIKDTQLEMYWYFFNYFTGPCRILIDKLSTHNVTQYN